MAGRRTRRCPVSLTESSPGPSMSGQPGRAWLSCRTSWSWRCWREPTWCPPAPGSPSRGCPGTTTPSCPALSSSTQGNQAESHHLSPLSSLLREGILLHSATVSLHINVVALTDSLRSEDSFFFVLAFVVGPSLALVLLIGTIEANSSCNQPINRCHL